ncbi:hypothetical protein K488DRAFT_83425 [Vararia minispora EC-137]|uniref:Uncharacterized protein n=1 Tax=Vararia minispora EC-137 TaxID=1314806 RepID=A0ACB8QT74_9AGAM|nr:hypothetical protein K488DRAFT_83425 [Vararia minispora EC-137]
MYRRASLRVAAARNGYVHSIRSGTRSLVSTVLLNRAWENETMPTLRAELQKRGLSAKGLKATLITRIREFDEQQARASPSPSSSSPTAAQTRTRNASTASAPPTSSSSPPPPLSPSPTPTFASTSTSPSIAPSYPSEVLDVVLPDLSAMPPPEPIQVVRPSLTFRELLSTHPQPLYPDMSSLVSTDSAPTFKELPKILVVGGESTHATSFNMLSVEDDPADGGIPAAPEPNTAKGLRGLAYDMLDDLGLPRELSLPPAAKDATALVADAADETVELDREAVRPKTRELNPEERWGATALVASLFGIWVLAGVFAPRPAQVETHDGTSSKKH